MQIPPITSSLRPTLASASASLSSLPVLSSHLTAAWSDAMSAPSVHNAAASHSVSAATAAAAAISRLPDGDSFSLFGETAPDKLPIIVKLPGGGHEQVHIPFNGTVDDLKNVISLPRNSNDELRLSFGNSDLDPSASLLDTNIVDAYEHAGSLLHVIGNGVQDMDTKAAAVNSVCAVVESISNGVKDMEALCDIATNPAYPTLQDPAINPDALSSMPKEPVISDHIPHLHSATPSALTHSLSRRLPDFFPPDATTAAFPADATAHNPHEPPIEAQPSISSIRDARRRAREAAGNNASISAPEMMPMSDDIGCSTYARPFPDTFDNRGSSAQKDASRRGTSSSLVLAQSGNTTWLGDVMKTWEVNAVVQSGVLEKSKDGQDISEYLARLGVEALEETLGSDDPSGERRKSQERQAAIDRDPEADDDGDDEEQPESAYAASLPNAQSNDYDHSQSAINTVQVNTPNIPLTHPVSSPIPTPPYQPFTPNLPIANSTAFPPHASNLIPLGSKPAVSAPAIVTQQGQLAFSPAPSSGVTTGSTPTAVMGHLSVPSPSVSSASAASGGKLVRRATKIAPAPVASVPTGQPATGNGMVTMPIFQGCPPITTNWTQPSPVVTVKSKKRGRKRKNPQLSEQERALFRKEQNRESARLSRVRRKVIAIEYEDKLKALVDENAFLRKKVDGLNNRLAYLQSILTVTVTQKSGA